MPPPLRRDRAALAARQAEAFNLGVFINCPFDTCYRPIRDALIFAVLACHFRARCALGASNFGQPRVDKIVALIRACRWGIHDLSQIQPNPTPHFNIPLELGLFLGAHRFGGPKQRTKSSLVLVRDKAEFRQACSNVDGQDVVAHRGEPNDAIVAVRDWLQTETRDRAAPYASGARIAERFAAFRMELPEICAGFRVEPEALTFSDTCDIISKWLIRDAAFSLAG